MSKAKQKLPKQIYAVWDEEDGFTQYLTADVSIDKLDGVFKTNKVLEVGVYVLEQVTSYSKRIVEVEK